MIHLQKAWRNTEADKQPGIGLGTLISRAKTITPRMITASAISLSEALTPEEESCGLLYPRLERIREVSAEVARGVVKCSMEEGVATNLDIQQLGEWCPVSTLRGSHSLPLVYSVRACRKMKLTGGIDDQQLLAYIKKSQWEA